MRTVQHATTGVAAVAAVAVQAGSMPASSGALVLAATSIASALLPALFKRKAKGAGKQGAGSVANYAQFVSLLAALASVADQLLQSPNLSPEHAVYLLMFTNVVSSVLPQLQAALGQAPAPADEAPNGE